MSRLIDADRIKPEDFYDRVDMYECMEVINDQPTAYDVEAVVRDLEAKSTVAAHKNFEAAEMGFERAAIHYQGIQDGLDYAIAIVKRGGRNE